MPPPSTPPPALTHATAAAAGTLLSTLLTYPLDLVTTRLKVQRQLPLVPSSDSNDKPTLVSAFRTILHDSQGDPRALYAGLRIDLVKSVVDSFLFFLFYTVRLPSCSLSFLRLLPPFPCRLYLLRPPPPAPIL